MDVRIRKMVTIVEEVRLEVSRPVEPPLVLAGAAAVVENPLAGAYVEDLHPFIVAHASLLGEILAEQVVKNLPMGAEAYGKSGVVGLTGEIEHVSGILHNLNFGNHLRSGLGGTALLSSTEKRAGAGATFDIPLKHVREPRERGHHLTLEFRIGDAPGPDELIVAMAGASGPRAHSRLEPFATETGGAEGVA